MRSDSIALRTVSRYSLAHSQARSLFQRRNEQVSCFQSDTHSLPRSCARAKKPIPSFSLSCALFVRTLCCGWPNCPRNGPAGGNLRRMNTYAKRAANPCRMRTSKIIGLKVSCNEHLQKSGGGGGLIVTQRRGLTAVSRSRRVAESSSGELGAEVPRGVQCA